MAREAGNEFDPDTYDDDQGFVAEYGRDLVDLLAPRPDERVLDLGCGTGHLTAEIDDRGARVVGIDASAAMVDRAREAHPDLQFHHVDATDFSLAEPADAVFSNAALHWIDDQDGVVGAVADALRPGGRFVAEMGGTGNVAAIVHAIRAEARARGVSVDSPWYFPSPGEQAVRLERHGFEIRLTRLFDRPTALAGEDGLRSWLAQFGDGLLESVEATEAADRAEVVAAVEDRLRPDLYDPDADEWVVDYRRLRFVAVREG